MTRDTSFQVAMARGSRSPEEYERLVFAALTRASADAIICTDMDGRVTSWNENATRIFGYRAEEMIGEAFLQIVPEECSSEERGILGSLPREGSRQYETARVAKNSAVLRVLGTACALHDENGTVIGTMRMERKISANSIGDDSQSRLAAIVESSDDAIVSKNLDGIVTSWNQAACVLFGHTADEMIGRSILTIIPEELHGEEAEILRKMRAGERVDHYETRRLRKDGQIIEVSLTMSPIRDKHGKIIGASKIAREISERKKMERLMIQSEKLAATGRMAVTIAHEINNPLDSVMNLVYLAKTSLQVNSRAMPYLIAAERELERVSHIARQTLGYYRDPGPPGPIRVEVLLEEVLSIYRSKLLASDVAVDCAFSHHREIVASKDELMQIFSNLIINAIDAMPNGGVLTIETREVGDAGVEVKMRDKGTGISEENLDRVFEPFFSTKGDRGTGIGLWVARQLLEKRGGSINLESSTEFPRNGTTVSVFVPFQP